MKHRLFVPPPLVTGQTIRLEASRAHYLTRVLRLRSGSNLLCFDGLGTGWRAEVEDDRTRSASLRILEVAEQQPRPEPELHLVQGLLKGSAMDRVIQKATELGTTRLWVVDAVRSNVSASRGRLERKLEHWQRIIESACEQCGQLHLPRLHEPQTLQSFLDSPPEADLIMLCPGAAALPLDLPATSLAILVGPEGGWSDEEMALAKARGVRLAGLGSLVLRAETAPLAALAAIRHGWGWVGAGGREELT